MNSWTSPATHVLPGDSRHRRVKDDDFSSGTMNFGMAAMVEMHNNWLRGVRQQNRVWRVQ